MTPDMIEALAGLARAGWVGTAAGLLDALPAAVRPLGANLLSAALRAGEGDLGAAGVTVTARREGGTGRRLLALGVSQSRPAETAASSAEAAPTPAILQPPPALDSREEQRSANAAADPEQGHAQASLSNQGLLGGVALVVDQAECDDGGFAACSAEQPAGAAFLHTTRPRAREALWPCYSFGTGPALGCRCSRCRGSSWWSRDGQAWSCSRCCPDVLRDYGQGQPHLVVT